MAQTASAPAGTADPFSDAATSQGVSPFARELLNRALANSLTTVQGSATQGAGPADPVSDAVGSPEASLFARELLKRALANSTGAPPAFVATAQALLANVLMNDVMNWWNNAGQNEVAEAERAVTQAGYSALAHQARGLIHREKKRPTDAQSSFQQAVDTDRQFARAHAQLGNQKALLGQAAAAHEDFKNARNHGQNHPAAGYFHWGDGRAFFQEQNWADAIKWLQKSVDSLETVWYNRCYLAAAQDAAGDPTTARKTMQDFLNDQRFGRPVLARAVAALANTTGVPSVDAARRRVHDFLGQF